jgi:response regulator RpfG family c-di-GMP phosphodiesterase
VIDALNAEGPEIDVILSEVDIPMTKGMKMLKYIMRDKDLRRIPVISKLISLNLLLSSVVVKSIFNLGPEY